MERETEQGGDDNVELGREYPFRVAGEVRVIYEIEPRIVDAHA